MPRDLTGMTLGKFQVIERLGRGGMAEVYRAFQPGMNRYVALKVMHGHLAEDPDFIARFNREAQSAGSLRHPNIVQVIDFDVQDGEYYMVMEFIKGESLKAMLGKRGALPVREVLTITAKLADAVAYAHEMGVIHRDIKPANVLMVAPDNPVLTDFGIARLSEVPGLTKTGMTVGTPEYMSPEAGMGEAVDNRTDIYSLGIVLYEMLTGNVPYGADTPFAVILKHIQDPLPVPAHLPESVEQILLKALAKNRDERYQTAKEFRDAVELARQSIGDQPGAVASSPVSRQSKVATPPSGSAAVSSVRPATRGISPLLMAAAAILVVLVVGGIIVSQVNNPPVTQGAQVPTVSPNTNPTPPTAGTTPDGGSTLEATAEPTPEPTAVAEASKYASLIAEVKRLLVAEEYSAALSKVDGALKNDPESYDLHVLRARAMVESGDEQTHEAGRKEGEEAVKRAPNRPEGYIVLGIYEAVWRQTPDNSEALVARYRKAVEYVTKAIDLGSDDYVAYWARAEANERINDLIGPDANVQPDAILKDIEKAVSFDPQDARPYFFLGNQYEKRGMYAEALRASEKVHQFNNYAMWFHETLAYRYILAGYLRKAFELYEGSVRENKPTDPSYLANAAFVAWLNREYKSASEWANTAVIIDPKTYPAVYVQGLVAFAQKDYEGALAKFDLIAKNGADNYGTTFLHPHRFDREINADRARALMQLGRLDEALEAMTKAIDGTSGYVRAYIERAQIYQRLGRIDDARQDLRYALDLVSSIGDDKQKNEILGLLSELPTPTP